METHSQPARRSLHLSIDPSPYGYRPRVSPETSSPSSSARTSLGTPQATTSPPTSGGSDWVIYSVLCLYDFDSNDPDHLPFRKNEILDVVRQESSGWWAVLRQNGNQVGWIPSAFVQPLSDVMAERLRHVQEEFRGFEYEAEKLYDSAPVSHFYDIGSSAYTDEWVPVVDDVKAPSTQLVTPTDLIPRRDFPTSGPRLEGNVDTYFDPHLDIHSPLTPYVVRPLPPPSPMKPMPTPPSHKPVVLQINKPTPPIPGGFTTTSILPSGSGEVQSPLALDASPTSGINAAGRHIRRRPMIMDDEASLSRLSTLLEGNVTKLDMQPSSDVAVKSDILPFSRVVVRTGSSRQSLEEEENAKVTMAHLPWYLRPSYTPEVLKIDPDNVVTAGTLPALVERLTAGSFKTPQDTAFREVFFMTFRTFASAEQVFDLLVENYQMDKSCELTGLEFEDWKERKLRTTQKRVLTIFTIWLEDYELLEEEPHIAQKLTDFLSLIISPAPLAITAKLMQDSLERLTFASPFSVSPLAPSQRRRKSKPHKNDLLRVDPVDVAKQLCLLEHRLYAKIRSQECLNWPKQRSGKGVAHLFAFCATHDKLVGWVKASVLNNELLAKRADTIDYWVKVAEKCRTLNNFSSMSAILTALSNPTLTRLQLSWAFASRKLVFENLSKINEPSGGYAGHRSLLRDIPDSGSCVPFVTMFLADIVLIQDQLCDLLPAPASCPDQPLIHFTKRQRWYDVISPMLRYQRKPYNFAENETTMKFIEGHLQSASGRDPGWYRSRSQEMHQLEFTHADIKKEFESAGF